MKHTPCVVCQGHDVQAVDGKCAGCFWTWIRGNKIPALSVRQPWAALILDHGKNLENRSRPTRYRGPLLIHAAKQKDTSAAAELHAAKNPLDQRGALIGVVDLFDVWTMPREHQPWFTGPFAWVLTNPRRLSQPIPGPGRLGLFRFEPHNSAAFEPHPRAV